MKTKVAEPVTSREVAEKIVSQWRHDFEDEQFTMPLTGWPLLSMRIEAALDSARADLARKMIEAAGGVFIHGGGSKTRERIITTLETVARDAGIDVET